MFVSDNYREAYVVDLKGKSMSMILSTMFRMTHPSLFNTKRFNSEDILVPGGAIKVGMRFPSDAYNSKGVMLAQAHACCARGLYEILYEELQHAQLLNPVRQDVSPWRFSDRVESDVSK